MKRGPKPDPDCLSRRALTMADEQGISLRAAARAVGITPGAVSDAKRRTTATPIAVTGDGIRCPICDRDTSVSETRQNRGSIRRRSTETALASRSRSAVTRRFASIRARTKWLAVRSTNAAKSATTA